MSKKDGGPGVTRCGRTLVPRSRGPRPVRRHFKRSIFPQAETQEFGLSANGWNAYRYRGGGRRDVL
jgi:hypothetical protein